MSDKFSPTPLIKLAQIALNQFYRQRSIYGIPSELFYKPSPKDPFRLSRFGKLLETPLGIAAGPHTQLAQNIVAAWLCGARYMELKTVQTLDNLEISKPCIDMQDEGYNCEWSQELKIRQSFDQYLDAWILIHVLKHLVHGDDFSEPGTIFNMSVGYNLEGIKKENVQWFLNKMQDATDEIRERSEHLKLMYPKISEININPCISDNVTLSTMHGCPPDEIEKIGLYLLREKKLHTTIKLNPTLLGKDQLNQLIGASGFDIKIPGSAFEHDLKFQEAVKIIHSLKNAAEIEGLHFGIKLTNTLECINIKEFFPEKEKMMYMSGLPLHPIAIGLTEKLQNQFNGKLDISFSGGLDAFNFSDVISCGLYPATVCSDILKPGGYGRLNQYLENLHTAFSQVNSNSLEEFIIHKAGNKQEIFRAILNNLLKYNIKINAEKEYTKTRIKSKSIKTARTLGVFDCIHAPCETTCPTNQGIPDYMHYASVEDFDQAKKIILQTNPFPELTGKVCDHPCQDKCTRINYDNPLLIRQVKRSIANNSGYKTDQKQKLFKNNIKVSIIGGGPSGLACANFLAMAGFSVDIYEEKDKPGGMAEAAIPEFRTGASGTAPDIENILNQEISIHYNQAVDKEKFDWLQKNSDYIYIAAGAQKARAFPLEGAELNGVINPLEFLSNAKSGKNTGIGKKILVIGGGNTAMDTARTAKRLCSPQGKVSILYRRSMKEMPANEEEIRETIEESIEIKELVNPVKINVKDEKIISLTCQKMKLGQKDGSGRKMPVPVTGSEFEIECDTIIPAVGQETDIQFIAPDLLKTKTNPYETGIPNVFIGGDALNGGVSVIAAIGDARRVAQIIIDRSEIDFKTKTGSIRQPGKYHDLMVKRSRREWAVREQKTEAGKRNNFEIVLKPLSREETIAEASRCLFCDELCNICTTVCPNLALFAYQARPFKLFDNHGNKIFEIQQSTQILHIADWCNLCGNCETFCPTSGAPHLEKPSLYLNKTAFNQADQAYYFIFTEDEQTLLFRKGTEIHSFAENPINFTYITKGYTAQINKQNFEIQHIQYRDKESIITLAKAAEMSVILEGARQFFGLLNNHKSSNQP
jgi:putative selenate reductase